jgi:hypothetical protein
VTEFGLSESFDPGYQTRTYCNVRDAGATIWFGTVGTSGHITTKRAASSYEKPFFENPTKEGFLKILSCFEIVNIAGNRRSVNASITEHVHEMFDYAAPFWKEERCRREEQTTPQQQGPPPGPPRQDPGPGQENRQEARGPIWDEQAIWGGPEIRGED